MISVFKTKHLINIFPFPENMLQRIQKIIANAGYCSRRKAEELIISGKVKVNNKKVDIGGKADSGKDCISIGDYVIKPEKKVYIVLNKPRGCITTSSDLYGRKKVLDLLDVKERVFPVGRLDRDVTGILFLTNDGDWANMVMHPRYGVEKIYQVWLDKPLRKEDKEKIENGVKLYDGFVRGKIKVIGKKRVEIKVRVGRNKIVKRIFNHLGYRVGELCRTNIGRITLGKLKQGKYRRLTGREIGFFRK